MISPLCHLAFDVAPYRLSGVVYGTLVNHLPAIAALEEAAHQPPYKAPAQAPVLYVKPYNTHARHGDAVTVPADVQEVEIGAALGIVIGRTACRVMPENAMDHIAGYTIVNDISVPHELFYRPSIRFKARDGFCPVGPEVVSRDAIGNADALGVRVYIDDVLVHRSTTGERKRPIARLLADVTEFMTLSPGDILMLGVSAGAPRVRHSQQARIEIDGLGQLENRFIAEGVLP